MIAIATPSQNTENAQDRSQEFLDMLPAIRKHASIAFRRLAPESREDAIQEVIANAFCAYRRLVNVGKADLAFPSPLAMYGIRQYRAGRRIGTKSNVNDVTSPYAQASKKICPGRLDHFDYDEGSWKEILLEDRHAGPAETAASRIDFNAWLKSLPARHRQIAEVLATGESTAATASRFCLSRGRISQIRSELRQAWGEFQDESGCFSLV